MRHVYIFQAQACLAHGRATFVDNDAVVYLVDDRSLQRKLSIEKLLSQEARLKLRQARDHERVLQLRAVFEDCENLLVLIQHDPDPDAIASGLALRTLLGRNKVTARIGSFGQVKRPENVIMV